MIKVVRYPGEDTDHFLKRFKKAIEKAGLVSELKRRAYYDKEAIRKEKDKNLLRKKAARAAQMERTKPSKDQLE